MSSSSPCAATQRRRPHCAAPPNRTAPAPAPARPPARTRAPVQARTPARGIHVAIALAATAAAAAAVDEVLNAVAKTFAHCDKRHSPGQTPLRWADASHAAGTRRPAIAWPLAPRGTGAAYSWVYW